MLWYTEEMSKISGPSFSEENGGTGPVVRRRHQRTQLGKCSVLILLHGANAASCTSRNENCS